MAKSKRKTEAQKEREAAKSAKPKAPEKPKTLDELLKPENNYERLVAEHVRGRHDTNLEAAIVANQRSVQKCLEYVAGMAQKKSKGAQCVVMSDEEVYGLAVHWFLDGDTPIETDAGESVEPAKVRGAEPANQDKPKAEPKVEPEKKAKKAKAKKKTEKKEDDGQMFFDFGPEAAETEVAE